MPLCDREPTDTAAGAVSASKLPPKPKPQRRIQIEAGLLHTTADRGIEAMHAAGIAFYQRDCKLVRVCRVSARTFDRTPILVPGIAPVRLPLLRRALGQAAYWERLRKNGMERVDPPKEVAEQIAEMIDEWPFPPLLGIIGCPTLRPDGSLLNKPGYDEATGLVLDGSLALPPIPLRPTKDHAQAALDRLNELLAEFPFRDDASKAVAYSQLITPVVRAAMTVAPMHLTTAPEAGTGKSYLADVASTIATGDRCPVIALSPNAEESEKRLLGAVVSGVPIIGLDNGSQVLAGDLLCQVTERPIMSIRALGSSPLRRIENTFTVVANGNNAAVADDLVRRTLTCSLDAEMEDPESRTFAGDPLAMINARRGYYVAACLTIPLAYLAADKPDRLPPLPSYEGYSDLVRSPLVWLGCADPVATISDARMSDPIRSRRRAVFLAWRVSIGMTKCVVAEIIRRAESDRNNGRAELYAALLAVAAMKRDESTIDPLVLGIWLRKNENTVVDRLKLVANRSDPTRPRWQLVELP